MEHRQNIFVDELVVPQYLAFELDMETEPVCAAVDDGIVSCADVVHDPMLLPLATYAREYVNVIGSVLNLSVFQ